VQRGEGGVGLLRRSRAHDALLGAPGVPAASVTARGDGTELPARGHADPRRGRGCWAALLLAAAAAVVVVVAGAAAGFLAAFLLLRGRCGCCCCCCPSLEEEE